MITCRRVVDMLIDYVAEEIPEGQRSVLDDHFRYCQPCQAYLESYRLTIRMTHELPREAPLPPELEARLRQAAEQIDAQDR